VVVPRVVRVSETLIIGLDFGFWIAGAVAEAKIIATITVTDLVAARSSWLNRCPTPQQRRPIMSRSW
jgi:hypothetical protein